MKRASVLLLSGFVIGGLASRASAVIYAQTGFNDQSGINSNPTVNDPYTLGGTINGVSNSEPGWTNAWRTLDGGGDGGDSFAVVSTTKTYEGDGALAITPGARGSTEAYRDFTPRFDEFVVEQRVNFGSSGVFNGQVIEDGGQTNVNQIGPQWQLAGNVGHRVFQVYNGNYDGTGTWVDTGIAQTPGQWQDVVMDINMVTETWTFSVDGVNYNQTLGFQRDISTVDAIYELNTAAGYVDSIIVRSVPEPTTLVGLGVSGALVMLRRRRRA